MKWFSGAVVLVAAAHFVNMLANSRLFAKFAFGDNGWPLTVDALLDSGLNPVTDFGYFYGLLTLLIDRAAFAAFGRTPDTIVGLYAACTLVIAVGLARLIPIARLRPLPSLLLVSFAGLAAIPRGFPSPAHALEAALLMTALAEHAAGRLPRALAFVVLAVFVKPSLGYVYGAILLVLILREPGRVRSLLPAALIGAGVLGLLVVRFGAVAVLRTQLPLDAMRAYREAGFGFCFGSGRPFWLPPKPGFDYYFGGIAGTWLLASVVLLLSAFGLRRRWREPVAGFTLAAAILHFCFVLFLFGNEWSWIYYSFILFAGTAVGLNLWPRRIGNLVALVLLIASVVGQSEWLWNRDAWTRNNTGRWGETAGLNAPFETAREWGRVREIAAGYPGHPEKVLVFTRMGCPQFLAPELDGPHWWCLIEGFTSKAELERARAQIREAEWIVSPDWHDNTLMKWPEFAAELQPLAEVDVQYEIAGERRPIKGLKLHRRKP